MQTLVSEKIKSLKCCVLIPTYNNAGTLQRVIDGVLQYTSEVIIVNDGSTDETSTILNTYTNIPQLHFSENKGKGMALRKGFQKALEMGYHYAITIDSDGQHYPKDIPIFIDTLEASNNKDLLLIGSRNMKQEGVPGKSSFGNRFSNFWFWVETGIWLEDTQSGFRLYPIKRLEDIKFYTRKFEFEIEVIVKAAWRDVEVKNVPINVLYDHNERVSHFRPFKDFTRISILNTWLVIVTFLVIKPRNLYRRYRRKGLRRFLSEDVFGHNDSPRKKALSIALGVFIGLSPFWGFHTVIVLALAVILKLNKAIAFTFSNVSLPPFIPFVLLASKEVGNFVLGREDSYDFATMMENYEMLRHLQTYIVGSFVLATVSAVVIGALSFILISLFTHKKVILKDG
ncbi:MAG: DUF2062 domain-containing protein [Flavobacteriaceae bacterium]|nr:DUF2062 domain-containing protein [Flavobacteriaceae bacterium]